MNTKYKFHELCQLFPVMPKKELRALADDIKANGQLEPIRLLDGKILDGRNRYLACAMVKVEPNVIHLDIKDAHAIVASLNLYRRHLTESQRAIIADLLAKLRKGEKRSDTSIDVSQSEAATALKVSVKSVQRARLVRTKVTRKLYNRVKSGDIKLSKAERIAKMPKEVQNDFVDKPDDVPVPPKAPEGFNPVIVSLTVPQFSKELDKLLLTIPADSNHDKYAAVLNSAAMKQANWNRKVSFSAYTS